MPERNRNPITTASEDREREINANRAEEQREARTAALARLAARGVNADDVASVEALAELLEAVEAFERAVELNGGDLMVDTAPSSEPDDPRFVLPRRFDDESVGSYTNRVRLSTDHLFVRPK